MEIITMEEKGYKELIDIVFEKLRELLGKELLKANDHLIQNDECRIKANEIQNSLADLLKQYRPELTYAPISMPQFKTKETYKQIMKNQGRHHELKIYLNEKKLIIKTQIDALDGRENAGFKGYYNGQTPVYVLNDGYFKLATGSRIATDVATKGVAMVVGGNAIAKGKAPNREVVTIQNPNGQGTRLLPLTRFGYAVVSAKGIQTVTLA